MKTLTKKILTTVILITIISFSTKAFTNVSGGIFANTTWTLAGSPYIVTDTVVVFPGVTLTIQPGVTVKFANDIRIEIRQAMLIASGTSTAPITFTSNSATPTAGIYAGIYLNGGTTPPVFNFCNFEYAYVAINTNNNYTLGIKNSNISNNNFGIQAILLHVNIDSCVFKNNNTGMQIGGGIISYSNIIQNQSGIVQEGIFSTIKNCIVDSNQTGISGSTGLVLSCVIKYNGTGLSCSYPTTVDSSSIISNQTGIAIGTNDSVKYCIVDSNSIVGIDNNGAEYPGYCLIINNKIRYNGIGITETGASPDRITKNIINNNSNGILVNINPVVPSTLIDLEYITCNEICNNTSNDIKYTGTNNTNIGSNYYCTADSASTAAVIYDGYDNANYGLVNFMPLDTSNCYLGITTGISTYTSHTSSFGIYPNPTNSNFTITFSEEQKNTTLKITDVLGREIRNYNFNGKTFTIDMSGESKGIYFVQKTAKGVEVRKVVLQ